MKNPLIRLALLLAIALPNLAQAQEGAVQANQRKMEGTVIVSSDPIVKGAEIFVNDQKVGQLPTSLKLAVGQQKIKIVAGFLGAEQTVDVQDSQAVSLTMKLTVVGPKTAESEDYLAYLALLRERIKRASLANDRVRSGKSFIDCDECPVMIVIPAGRFRMGSPAGEIPRRDNEGPVHTVTVQAFALGKLEVTRGQYAAFTRETGYEGGNQCRTLENGKIETRSGRNWHNPGHDQDDNHPVSCLNWEDAQVYVAWLATKTGKQYRLPSESEWEYAARAGVSTARYWGNDADKACTYANVADQAAMIEVQFPPGPYLVHNCDDGLAYTAPGGRYKPNAFGLHDMIGNVWEWTSDCWNDSYNAAPSNGSAWTSGDCGRRVFRGGSWGGIPPFTRLANRSGGDSSYRSDAVGFRVALSLTKTN